MLPPVNGGTGLTSYAKGDIIYADTGGVLFELAIGSAGDVLTVSASGIPEWAPQAVEVVSEVRLLILKSLLVQEPIQFQGLQNLLLRQEDFLLGR